MLDLQYSYYREFRFLMYALKDLAFAHFYPSPFLGFWGFNLINSLKLVARCIFI